MKWQVIDVPFLDKSDGLMFSEYKEEDFKEVKKRIKEIINNYVRARK